ncbi:hypothetical protein CC78DRAFT_546386 [Lojkania enalia]|uniref:Uncharacterized protein n=1 Tax=Lojkania enalia TaxID=147567 RepID=A0A9P4N7D8_9PLEO|nr:hypothetical protein CC78DRAFT_546386 [Didymosphaeria enalia]
MASTTLFTFLFDCPAAARTIELLGSWDNFTKPYFLKRDKRRSPYLWSGCFAFDDIICDGDFNSICGKRSGALMMGGTYWYYYKVDGEERHNPREPSTTVCPLLPGQRLNVLEVPIEPRSSSSSQSSAFTRNPEDKYLTPVPPKPVPSPFLRDFCKETYSMPLHSIKSPRSATYPPPVRSPSPTYERQTRSTSATPLPTPNAVFPDFRAIKDKLAPTKWPASDRRERSRERPHELQIGAPTLISTTAEEMNLVPLPLIAAPQTAVSLPTPITARMREFSPLGSNPVGATDLDFEEPTNSTNAEKHSNTRPRSHTESGGSNRLKISTGRARSNSADTRRTKQYQFSNEPWISSPKFPEVASLKEEPAPVLEQPPTSLQLPKPSDERPSSRRGGDPAKTLRKSPFDKELPALPRYLVPAPLFACISSASTPTLGDEEVEKEEALEHHGPREYEFTAKASHFSAWSTDSATFSCPTSDEEAVHSPTFSSLTSNSSVSASPRRFSVHFANSEQVDDKKMGEHPEGNEEINFQRLSIASNPPRLHLSIPSSEPSLFQLDIHRPESASRRQVACFGLSEFQGCSLPEDKKRSHVTIIQQSLKLQPLIGSRKRLSSVGQLDKLVNEFGYLGDSVL